MEIDHRKIESHVAAIAQATPELAQAADACMKAVDASRGRAELPEAKIAAAAQRSIGGALMRFAITAFCCTSRSDVTDAAIVALVNIVSSLKIIPDQSEHSKTARPALGQQWRGPTDGPWQSRIKNHEVDLIHTPQMPGGSWSVRIAGVPSFFGDDPNEIEDLTHALFTLAERTALKSARRRPDFLT